MSQPDKAKEIWIIGDFYGHRSDEWHRECCNNLFALCELLGLTVTVMGVYASCPVVWVEQGIIRQHPGLDGPPDQFYATFDTTPYGINSKLVDEPQPEFIIQM